MDDTAFDDALIASAFTLAAADGWQTVTVAAAARAAGLKLDRARARFPGRFSILLRLGRRADQMALQAASAGGAPRDLLFDMIMRRFDAFQPHRNGVRALLRALPLNPALTLELGLATAASMTWLLDAAGISTAGLRGALRVKGLSGVWLYTLRAWDRDDSPDLSGTMAALDRALNQAERVAGWMETTPQARAPAPFPDVPGAGQEAGAL